MGVLGLGVKRQPLAEALYSLGLVATDKCAAAAGTHWLSPYIQAMGLPVAAEAQTSSHPTRAFVTRSQQGLTQLLLFHNRPRDGDRSLPWAVHSRNEICESQAVNWVVGFTPS
ncbi:hypothetical protein EDB85DRAFT_1885979 [Lactarius pseudohatsudake]|nr:hypothetical protein EDB85DRAFT_1885979 [Lactarius pseudohatsudake]